MSRQNENSNIGYVKESETQRTFLIQIQNCTYTAMYVLLAEPHDAASP